MPIRWVRFPPHDTAAQIKRENVEIACRVGKSQKMPTVWKGICNLLGQHLPPRAASVVKHLVASVKHTGKQLHMSVDT